MASFFHTLVVFGASASLAGCGGRASSTGGLKTSDPAGGHAGGGASGSDAGDWVFGAGGTPGAGGASADAGSLDPETVAQWNCDGEVMGCTRDTSGASRFSLSGPCPVEPSRPRSAADCNPNTWFECALAMLGDVTLSVNCQCVLRDAQACGACSLTELGSRPVEVENCTDPANIAWLKRCGCAYPHIVK